uniref:Putative glycosyltransferase n=1 Tax=viral metagenome TaxID=1070528 RepID=A0A6M3J217_9ZZZZ
MLIVSYHTPSYDTPARMLALSCERFGLTLDAWRVPERESWRHATRKKAAMIRDLVRAHPKEDRIVWIDADSVIMKPPVLFEKLDCDIATRLWNKRRVCGLAAKIDKPSLTEHEPMTGVLFMRNNAKVHRLLDAWVIAQKEAPFAMTRSCQRTFGATLLKMPEIRFTPLPIEYCFWQTQFPLPLQPGSDNAVIWVTRWLCKDAERARVMANEEKRRRENGTWKKEEWVW